MEVEDVDSIAKPRPLWPLAVGAVALVLVGAGVWLWFPRTPAADRVLVAAGCGPGCAEAFEREVERTLSAGGFDVVRAGEAAPADAEAARRAAHDLSALHSVWLELEVVEERPGSVVEPAYVHARGRAVASVVTGDSPRESAWIEMASYGSDPAEARADVASRIGAALADGIHLALLERDEVATWASSPNVSAEDIPRQTSLRETLELAERVRQEQAWMVESCEEAAAALTDDAGPAEVRCISHACAEEYAFDVLPDGSAALVHTETPSVRVPVGERQVAGLRVESVERVEVVPLDGSARRVIGTSNNYYTYPSMSPDGARVVAIEEWDRGFGLVAIDVADGARTVLGRFDRYLQGPEVSPDGESILAVLRATRRSPAQLVVLPLDAPEDLRLIAEAHVGTWVSLPTAPDAPPRTLIVETVEPDAPVDAGPLDGDVPAEGELEAPSEDEPDVPDEIAAQLAELERAVGAQTAEDAAALPPIDDTRRLALLDPRDGTVVATLDDDRHRVRRVAGAHDGEVLFTWSNRRLCGVGGWTPATATARFAITEGCLSSPSVTPDGRLVGADRASADGDPDPSDDEIVEVDPADGTHRVLTANALRERYPRPVGGGPRILFDRLGDRRYRSFPRVATCWLERPD